MLNSTKMKSIHVLVKLLCVWFIFLFFIFFNLIVIYIVSCNLKIINDMILYTYLEINYTCDFSSKRGIPNPTGKPLKLLPHGLDLTPHFPP